MARIPSIAYRLCQPLKDAAKLYKSDTLTKVYNDNTSDRTKIIMTDDFLSLISSDWKSKIGKICVKARKTAKAVREEVMAVENDIVKLASFIEGKYSKTLQALEMSSDKSSEYNMLMHILVTHIMLLVRRRPVDFKNAKLIHYNKVDKHDELIYIAHRKDLNPEDLKVCK